LEIGKCFHRKKRVPRRTRRKGVADLGKKAKAGEGGRGDPLTHAEKLPKGMGWRKGVRQAGRSVGKEVNLGQKNKLVNLRTIRDQRIFSKLGNKNQVKKKRKVFPGWGRTSGEKFSG